MKPCALALNVAASLAAYAVLLTLPVLARFAGLGVLVAIIVLVHGSGMISVARARRARNGFYLIAVALVLMVLVHVALSSFTLGALTLSGGKVCAGSAREFVRCMTTPSNRGFMAAYVLGFFANLFIVLSIVGVSYRKANTAHHHLSSMDFDALGTVSSEEPIAV